MAGSLRGPAAVSPTEPPDLLGSWSAESRTHHHQGIHLNQIAEEFESLALPHLGAVARFALSLTRDQADADDLVQDAFLRARQSWHTFDKVGDARKWLFAICRNSFLSGLRR
ncbi:MAG: sigma factor, partial [Gemmatimonadales bacterium]